MRKLFVILFSILYFNSFSQELKASISAIIDVDNIISCDNKFLINEYFILQYEWSGKGKFQSPIIKDFEIVQESPIYKDNSSFRSNQLVVINGDTIVNKSSNSNDGKRYKRFILKPKKLGKFKTPKAAITKGDTSIQSNQLDINILNCKKYKGKPFIKREINKNLFLGEQTPFKTMIYISPYTTQFNHNNFPIITIDNVIQTPVPFVEEWKRVISKDCKVYFSKIIDYKILTTDTIGAIIIDAISINANFNDLEKKVYVNDNISDEKITINVKELPKPEPKYFYGTVSEKFEINATIDRPKLKTSEAINFKLSFRGNGNINMLEPFELKFPSSFRVFEPKIIDKTFVGNKNTGGTKTFQYVIIPRDSGEFTIPEIKFVYFNPKTKKHIELNTKSHAISVEQGKQYTPTDTDTTQNGLQNLDLLENLGLSSITKRQFISKWYSILYWIIFALIILSYLVYFILSKRSIDPAEIKRRKSTKIAIKRLKNASFCLKNNNFDQFFEEIEKSLWGYFADKFEVNSSELSKETIDIYFNNKNIKTETKNNFVSLLNICEFARYSPSKDRNQQMEKTLEDAKEIIIEVESDIKKK